MCKVCLQHPCHPRCPNAPEPPPVTKCSNCGEKIFEDDIYYDIDGEEWCDGCMKECRRIAERR